MNTTKHVSLNLNIRGLGQSATLGIKEICRKLRQEGRSVYDFGLGQSPFPVPAPVVESLRHSAHEKDYLPVKGLPALREAVADFHKRTDGIEAHADNVIVGPGSKELMFLLQLVYYGEIIVPTPCWVSYVPQAKIIGRRVSLADATWETRWKIQAEQFEKSIELTHDDFRPRLMVLNYPSNPCGTTYTETELKELAEVARKYQIVVLADEIYGQLHHEGNHVSIGRFYPEGTIVSSGLSKWCAAGGWRLGTLLFPSELDWLLDAISTAAGETYTSVSSPIQHAAVTAFRGGVQLERYLWRTRRILKALGEECARILNDGGLRVHTPDGGFYLFIDFTPLTEALEARGITNSIDLCAKLLRDTGVAIINGAAFARSRSELTARLSYVDFDGARALAASETISPDQPLPEDFLDQWCGNVLEGVRKIADWARGEIASAE